MIFSFGKTKQTENPQIDLLESNLHDESTFYQAFLNDLENCQQEVIIESPYITTERAKILLPTFRRLLSKGVKVYIITRNPKEHDLGMEYQSEEVISYFDTIGVEVLLCVGNHHRKLAILDRNILWEGSLNILSQTHSREIMRRIKSKELSLQMFNFLKLGKFL